MPLWLETLDRIEALEVGKFDARLVRAFEERCSQLPERAARQINFYEIGRAHV